MKTFFFVFTLLLNTSFLLAQLPGTHLFLFDMEQVTDSQFDFSNGKYLSAFNPEGYNNQPRFFNDNEIYLTAQLANDTTQTDIVALNLRKKSRTLVTASTDSEYSPTLMPDGKHFSCIRVEDDGKNTQRLWQFPVDRSNDGKPLLEETLDVGYHCWLDENKLALFIVGDPHSLMVVNVSTGTEKVITGNIGRGFGLLPDGSLVYVSKLLKDRWELKLYNPLTERKKSFIDAVPGSEDFTILQDGTVLMASGSKLYKFNRAIDKNWVEIADFSTYGIFNISRLDVNGGGNRLVLVGG